MTGPTIQSLFPFTIPERWTPEQGLRRAQAIQFCQAIIGHLT
jgi:hypothetical protein